MGIRRRNGERGGALIELTMVVLPLMVIMMGMVEIGGAWKDQSSAVQASRQGARVVTSSSIATTEEADKQALLAVLAGVPEDTSSGASNVAIRAVYIYNADDPNALDQCRAFFDPAPRDPTTVPQSATLGRNNCNAYLAGNSVANGGNGVHSLNVDEINAGNWVDNANSSGEWGGSSSHFNATDRDNTVTVAGRPDPVGVYVEMNREWITGFFPGDGLTIGGFTIMQIEPEAD